jgi:hypothetical protein
LTVDDVDIGAGIIQKRSQRPGIQLGQYVLPEWLPVVGTKIPSSIFQDTVPLGINCSGNHLDLVVKKNIKNILLLYYLFKKVK